MVVASMHYTSCDVMNNDISKIYSMSAQYVFNVCMHLCTGNLLSDRVIGSLYIMLDARNLISFLVWHVLQNDLLCSEKRIKPGTNLQQGVNN